MINRWQGNSGRVQRLPEPTERTERAKNTAPPSYIPPPPPRPAPSAARKPSGILAGLEGLQKLIPGKAEAIETEDIILMLILYLMYRESGDTELLMIMGAMFLL